MPELAEVELARRIWSAGCGQAVRDVDCHPRVRIFRDCPAGQVATALTGRTLTSSRTHGKRMLFTFGGPAPPVHLELHLGMSGRLALAAPDAPGDKHDHLILRLPELSLVFSDYRQFGRVLVHRSADPWADLPREVLAPRFTRRYLETLLARRHRSPVKAVLLDQSCFPGVGNWMADEICWRMKVHPATPVSEIDLGALRSKSRFVCRGALRHVADRNEVAPQARAEGFAAGRYVAQVPPPSWLFQHRWRPEGTCPQCRSTLARGTVATRTTAWCPSCQPPRSPEP